MSNNTFRAKVAIGSWVKTEALFPGIQEVIGMLEKATKTKKRKARADEEESDAVPEEINSGTESELEDM